MLCTNYFCSSDYIFIEFWWIALLDIIGFMRSLQEQLRKLDRVKGGKLCEIRLIKYFLQIGVWFNSLTTDITEYWIPKPSVFLQKVFAFIHKFMTLQILFRFDQLLTVVMARYKTEILEINKIKFRFGSWDFFLDFK